MNGVGTIGGKVWSILNTLAPNTFQMVESFKQTNKQVLEEKQWVFLK